MFEIAARSNGHNLDVDIWLTPVALYKKAALSCDAGRSRKSTLGLKWELRSSISLHTWYWELIPQVSRRQMCSILKAETLDPWKLNRYFLRNVGKVFIRHAIYYKAIVLIYLRGGRDIKQYQYIVTIPCIADTGRLLAKSLTLFNVIYVTYTNLYHSTHMYYNNFQIMAVSFLQPPQTLVFQCYTKSSRSAGTVS
jgi:hypothetical protein